MLIIGTIQNRAIGELFSTDVHCFIKAKLDKCEWTDVFPANMCQIYIVQTKRKIVLGFTSRRR